MRANDKPKDQADSNSKIGDGFPKNPNWRKSGKFAGETFETS